MAAQIVSSIRPAARPMAAPVSKWLWRAPATCMADVAALTGLSWDTVKDIVKAHLARTHGHPRLKELRRLSIDKLFVGRQKKFYTLVIDLDSGRIVWAARSRGVPRPGERVPICRHSVRQRRHYVPEPRDLFPTSAGASP